MAERNREGRGVFLRSNVMEFRDNIIFSIVLHAMIFTAALALAGRGLAVRPAERFISVSLFEDHAEDKALTAGRRVKKKPFGQIRKSAEPPRETLPPGAAPLNERFSPAPPAAIAPDMHPHHDETLPANGPPAAVATMTSAPHAGGSRGGAHGQIEASIIREPAVPAGRTGGGGKGAAAGGSPLKVDAIRAAIEKAKSYPPLARERGLEGTVTAEFTISAEGHPENIRILRSSGHEILDAAAKKTLLRASPFPSVPGRLEVPITFRLDR